MALLPVLTYPNKTLKEVSKPLKKVTKSIRQLADDMFETMYVEDGIGLAAPQVGELINLIVIDVGKDNPLDEEDELPDPVALINPEIIISSGTIEYDEKCLSCPDLIVTVDRLADIKVRYMDLEGQICTLDAQGLKAVCIQHEIDHLNGVLLVDRVSRLQRGLYKKKRVRIAKNEEELLQAL